MIDFTTADIGRTVRYKLPNTGKITYYEETDPKDNDGSKRINGVTGASLLHHIKAVVKKKQ